MTEFPTAPKGVSVVIPTINREAVLANTVRDMLRQDYPDWELIIVDQSEAINEAVLSLLRESPVPWRYYHADFKGLPLARNFGWRAATKDIVLYIDDDIECAPGFIAAHAAAHSGSGAALIAGGITEARGDFDAPGPVGSFNWWTATSIRNFHRTVPGVCLHAPGGNFSIRRPVLEAIGGFDEMLTVGSALYEETELALRFRAHGEKAWFAPDAHLRHLAAPSGGCRVPDDWPRYMHGLAHNRGILIFRHLRWWHRPTAIARLLLLGLSYCRLDGSLRPASATLQGLRAGARVASQPPLQAELGVKTCISC